MPAPSLDLLLFKGGRRVGIEIKRSDALYVVYPGPRRYHLTERVEAVPLAALLPATAGSSPPATVGPHSAELWAGP